MAIHRMLNKSRIFRLRQFQGQDYLIGKMSALSLSPLAARAWLLFDGTRTLAEISAKLNLASGRPLAELERELKTMADFLVSKEALQFVDMEVESSDSGEVLAQVANIPRALLWGGYNN